MVKGYSRTQIGLHWAVAALIFFNLLRGEDMSAVWDIVEDGGVAQVTLAAWAHILAGSAVLVLVLWRLALRLTRGVPPAPEGEKPVMKLLASLTHWSVYALMIALPVTGLLAWYGGIEDLAELHGEFLKVLLWALIVLHVAAAFYHQFVLKNGLMDRMRKPQA